MKRKLSLILIIILIVSTGCRNTEATGSEDATPNEEITSESDSTADTDEAMNEASESDEATASNEANEAQTSGEDANVSDSSEPKSSPYLANVDPNSFEVDEDAFCYSSLEFAGLLKAGWNLGNTLDAQSMDGLLSEVAWGQPMTTKELINFIKESGFTSIRIPVSWGYHTSGDDYEIDADWMARVKEIVDWAIDADLYVIINSHHDNDFYYPTEEHLEKSLYYIDCIWSQIATVFRDYDEHLIFEAMNEPRLSGTDLEWGFDVGNPQGVEALGCISQLNQRFVDIIRKSGGNNTLRYIMISGYAGNPDITIDNNFEIATDPANHMLMSIHAYTPYEFAMDITGYRYWDKSLNTEFAFMDKAKEYFIDKGIGVSITEMGATNKNNLTPRTMWFYFYTQKASSLGISCFVWDNGNNMVGEECFGFIGRTSLKVIFPELLEALTINYRDETD